MRIKFEEIKSVSDNISRYLKKECSLAERASFNISELVSFVVKAASKDVKNEGFFTEDAPLEVYMPPRRADSDLLCDVLEENLDFAKTKLATADSAYIADFCKKATALFKSNARLKPTPALFATKDSYKLRGGRVAFSESNMLTSAFEEFRKSDGMLSASYVRSFSDACEDVYSGECEWCILPIENSRDGALLSVYNLIEKYELCISKVCVINNEELTTKFALLCATVHGIIEMQNEQSVVLRMSVKNSLAWARIYTGASLIGVSPSQTVAIPLGYTDGYAHVCTFTADGESLFAFLLFLSTIRVDFTMIGAYE